MKVKIFQGYSTMVGMEINDFIENNNISIIDVKLTSTTKSNDNIIVIALLLYVGNR